MHHDRNFLITHFSFSSISANSDFLVFIGHGRASDAVVTQHTTSIASFILLAAILSTSEILAVPAKNLMSG